MTENPLPETTCTRNERRAEVAPPGEAGGAVDATPKSFIGPDHIPVPARARRRDRPPAFRGVRREGDALPSDLMRDPITLSAPTPP